MYVDMRAQTWPCSPWINVATHKSQSCCFPGLAVLQNAEVSQLWCLGVPGVAPRAVYIAAGCTHVFALLVAVKVQLRMLAAEQHGHPYTFWKVLFVCAATQAHFWGCGLACLLPFLSAFPACRTTILAPTQETWMKDASCRSSTHSLQKAKRLQSACARNWSRKFGSRATNIDALWPHFWVQNLALVLGPQNTNRSYWIGTASMLLPAQADSRTYPWYCVYIYICVCIRDTVCIYICVCVCATVCISSHCQLHWQSCLSWCSQDREWVWARYGTTYRAMYTLYESWRNTED